jgi:hypothetical protein
MANVEPPQIIRVTPPNAGDRIGLALRQAFGARQDRLPAFLEALLARLRLRR